MFQVLFFCFTIISSFCIGISVPKSKFSDESAWRSFSSLKSSESGSGLALVVPYYSGDICRMDLLAKSFYVHNKGTFSRVYLIWMGDRKDVHFPNEYISYLNSPRLFYQDQFDISGGGWHNQQKVKLLIANYIAEDTYVVLDSKTAILKDLTRDYFLPENKIRLYQKNKFEKLPPIHQEFYTNTMKFMNLTPEQFSDHYFPESITPFTMRTQTVKESLNYLKERNFDLNEIINHGQITEFVFYYIYDLSINQGENNYIFKVDNSIDGYWQSYSESLIAERLEITSNNLDQKTLLVIHRGWLKNVDSEERKAEYKRKMAQFLIRSNLITHEHEMCQ